MNQNPQQNSLQAWMLASRPKTLAAAAAPVIVGTGLAYHYSGFNFVPALICLIFALLMQVAANLINDLIDYLKGGDREDRLGPQRATAQGWITPHCMKIGICVVVGLACLAGLAILFFTTWKMIFVGLLCVIFAYFYTSGPYPLSYNGLGDIAVVVFFGIVPVGFTCFCQCGIWDWRVTAFAIGVGLAVNTLLIVNNYRDRETDPLSGKRTIIVIFGERFGELFYLGCGLVASAVAIFTFFSELNYTGIALQVIYILFHTTSWNQMCKIKRGKELNKMIGASSRNMLIYAIVTTIGLCVCR